jgi:hypothetical protein
MHHSVGVAIAGATPERRALLVCLCPPRLTHAHRSVLPDGATLSSLGIAHGELLYMAYDMERQV